MNSQPQPDMESPERISLNQYNLNLVGEWIRFADVRLKSRPLGKSVECTVKFNLTVLLTDLCQFCLVINNLFSNTIKIRKGILMKTEKHFCIKRTIIPLHIHFPAFSQVHHCLVPRIRLKRLIISLTFNSLSYPMLHVSP